MVFHRSLSDCKSPQVSRTRLNILAVLNNAVVWVVFTRPPTSKSSSPFSNPLVTVPKAPITIGIIVTCTLHSVFQFSSKVDVLILLFTFFQFYPVVSLKKPKKNPDFFTSVLPDGFHLSLSDSKSPQVFRTLLRIFSVLNNAVGWLVSTRPLTSKSSSPFYNLLITVTNAPTIICIIVTFMFHIFF